MIDTHVQSQPIFLFRAALGSELEVTIMAGGDLSPFGLSMYVWVVGVIHSAPGEKFRPGQIVPIRRDLNKPWPLIPINQPEPVLSGP